MIFIMLYIGFKLGGLGTVHIVFSESIIVNRTVLSVVVCCSISYCVCNLYYIVSADLFISLRLHLGHPF